MSDGYRPTGNVQPVALRPLVAQDFTGGLNLRTDPFQIGETEVPETLNMVVDPRAGIKTRRGWGNWNAVDTGADAWDPKMLVRHEGDLFLVNGTKVWTDYSGSWAALAPTVGATNHGASLADWGADLFVAAGKSNASFKWSAGTPTTLTDPAAGGGAGWTTDPLSPVANMMPKAELACSHSAHMWVANTSEDGSDYPNRIRWSLPNDPDAWDELDYIDIDPGGDGIVAVMPWKDRLFVFKRSAVFMVYGNSRLSFEPIEITLETGTLSQMTVAKSESAVYYFAGTNGVWQLDDTQAAEVSERLRPAFDGQNFNEVAAETWLGFCGRMLWLGCPYDLTTSPTTAKTVFQMDPSIGAWMLHQSSDSNAVGPFVEGEDGVPLACSRSAKGLVQLDYNPNPRDEVTGTKVDFEAFFRTRWMNAGRPTHKKRWKRPDFVMAEADSDYTITLNAYMDYDEVRVVRTKTFTIDAGGSGIAWGGGVDWGDTDEFGETITWGAGAAGGQMARASSLGNGSAIQLEFVGPNDGVPWGLSNLTLKYALRSFR